MNLFSLVKQRINILDVIGSYIQLRPAGHYWKASCPFHSEKDASFTVSPDKQIFYCFGCHASGDAISFIAQTERLGQKEAVVHLIDKYGIDVPQDILKSESIKFSKEEREQKDRYFAICKVVAQWCHQQLKASSVALAYTAARNLSTSTIQNFMIGYFPSGQTALKSLQAMASEAGILMKDIINAGILADGKMSMYSPFEERIIFPIRDWQGKFCGFGGRVFKHGDERPKYYNSKEADGFEKGKLLFGLDTAKKPMQESAHVFLVEGYMDCVMMHQYGYTNTVATLGTACTSDHLKLLSRFVHTLYVLYDGDNAGQKAMIRLAELCWEVNLEVKVITLPKEHDPASLLTSGYNLQDFVAEAKDIFAFFIGTVSQDFANKPLSVKLGVAEKIIEIIFKLNNSLKQELLLHQAASALGLSYEVLRQQLRTRGRQQKITPNIPAEQAQSTEPLEDEDWQLLEEKLISAMICSSNLSEIDDKIIFLRPYLSEQTQYLAEYIAEQKKTGHAETRDLFDALDEDYKEWAIKIVMRHDGPSCLSVVDHIITRLCKHHWQKIVKDIKDQIVKAKRENNNQMVNDVLAKFAALKQGMLARGLIR